MHPAARKRNAGRNTERTWRQRGRVERLALLLWTRLCARRLWKGGSAFSRDGPKMDLPFVNVVCVQTSVQRSGPLGACSITAPNALLIGLDSPNRFAPTRWQSPRRHGQSAAGCSAGFRSSVKSSGPEEPQGKAVFQRRKAVDTHKANGGVLAARAANKRRARAVS